MMKQYIKSVLSPTTYHGNGWDAPFFEGWYFKLVDASQKQIFAIIPGIYKGVNVGLSHAFIMVLNGATQKLAYHRFSLDDFHARTDQFKVRIGNNEFSAETLSIDLPNLKGSLEFGNPTPWPMTLTSPGIMGWYAWVPIMECYHGVVSMDHGIRGTLTADGNAIDMSGGRGYTEKDWGQAFPKTWIWMQANHFSTPGTSLSASIARIPLRGQVFPGFIIGLSHAGKLYRFTTYLQSQLSCVQVNGKRVKIVVRNRSYRLEISAEPPANHQNAPMLLKPTRGEGMVPAVQEILGASVHILLTRANGTVVFEGKSDCAGLEIEGDTKILETI